MGDQRYRETLRPRLGIAMAQRTDKACRSVLYSPRWQRIYHAGARLQRQRRACTGAKDPMTSDLMYVRR